MYQNPRRAKKLFLDIIPKSTDEFLSHLNKFDEQNTLEKLNNPIWHIMNGKNDIGKISVSYNLILNLVSASGKNDSATILDFVKKYDQKINESNINFVNEIISGAMNFEKDVTSEKINFKVPSNDEKLIFKDLASRMTKIGENADPEMYQTEIYQVGKDYKFENLRDWFKLIYQVLFGKDDGPRFGTFVAIYGVNETIKLINEKIN